MQKILIVEDDTNINNLLQEALSKAGYSCEQAFSGTEAKLLLNMQEHSYALVLLDLMLPGITGEAVLEEIRKKGNLPVIVLTAKGSLDEKVKVLTSGADDYITKPFEIREVLARIQVQLRHTEEKEIKESNLSFREMVLNKATFQAAANGIVFGELEWGNTKAILSYFVTELALHYALVLICMAIAIILKNNVISMVIAVCLSMNVMTIVYGVINSAIQKIGIQNFQIYKYTITGKLSLLPMNPSRNECLAAFGVAIVFIVMMISVSSVVFQKRDI